MEAKSSEQPAYRKLRGYAFDPSLSLAIDTANINSIVYSIPWEDNLKPGPKGEYIEVIDYDPTVNKFYKPVNLDERYLLANNGLNPSISNPQFHQQMVYAVAMVTIKNFEKALGRPILWASRLMKTEADPEELTFDEGYQNKKYNYKEEYVPQLRIYPHAFREPNAYYSPNRKAILFGYFSSQPSDETLHMPGSLVFTCLSHDIITHEVTHAILDGMHRHYNKPTNPDVLAFHEAFSDIVALFQHFTFHEVLAHQIRLTKGNLSGENLLGQLASEFGVAIGHYGALRDFIGSKTKDGWKIREPNPDEYRMIKEPHARGSILVAAVFEAFVSIYNNRSADLIRLVSNGSGILNEGELHPDLVNRLAKEASKSAEHILQMCIRALDYCPPIDITFGDYLRAIITADMDVEPEDALGYRLAFIAAFRRRGIYPEGISTLSVESLRYKLFPNINERDDVLFGIIAKFLREYRNQVFYKKEREDIYKISRIFLGGGRLDNSDYNNRNHIVQGLHHRMFNKFSGSETLSRLTGLIFSDNWRDLGVRASKPYDGGYGPSFYISNLRLVSRTTPTGNTVNQIIFSISQTIYYKIKSNGDFDRFYGERETIPEKSPKIKGGCTMIFDLNSMKLKYAIPKPLIKRHHNDIEVDTSRAIHQNNYISNNESHHFGLFDDSKIEEPFAFLHHVLH